MKKKKGEKKQADYMEDEDVSNLFIFCFCRIFFQLLYLFNLLNIILVGGRNR